MREVIVTLICAAIVGISGWGVDRIPQPTR